MFCVTHFPYKSFPFGLLAPSPHPEGSTEKEGGRTVSLQELKKPSLGPTVASKTRAEIH